jgi:anthranilate phosphoribosyltransferase
MLDATALGLPRVTIADLRGGDAAHNAGVVRDLLAGKPGPVRDAVLVNAAAAIVAHDGTGADGDPGRDGTADLYRRLSAALVVAAQAIDGGGAADVLERWVESSRRGAPLG